MRKKVTQRRSLAAAIWPRSGEQSWGADSGSKFSHRCGANFGSKFGEQIFTALRSKFWEQIFKSEQISWIHFWGIRSKTLEQIFVEPPQSRNLTNLHWRSGAHSRSKFFRRPISLAPSSCGSKQLEQKYFAPVLPRCPSALLVHRVRLAPCGGLKVHQVLQILVNCRGTKIRSTILLRRSAPPFCSVGSGIRTSTQPGSALEHWALGHYHEIRPTDPGPRTLDGPAPGPIPGAHPSWAWRIWAHGFWARVPWAA